jgi:hypothetical protein
MGKPKTERAALAMSNKGQLFPLFSVFFFIEILPLSHLIFHAKDNARFDNLKFRLSWSLECDMRILTGF